MPKKLEELTYYQMDDIEKLRWHLVHDCTCGYLESDEYMNPSGHYKGCPMSNPNDESWDYIYWYDYSPSL